MTFKGKNFSSIRNSSKHAPKNTNHKQLKRFFVSKLVLIKPYQETNKIPCMTNKNKIMSFLLLFLFISGMVTVVFNPVLASELVEDSWSTKTPMNFERYNLGVVAVNGKIYAVGGLSNSDGVVGINERYNPKTDKGVTLEPMPTSRYNFAIAEYQGKIYCAGGTNSTGSLCSIIEVYDPATNEWSTKASLPRNVSPRYACVLNVRFSSQTGRICLH